MEKILEKIVAKLDSIEAKQNSFEETQDRLVVRVADMDAKIGGFSARQNSFEETQDLLAEKIASMDAKIGGMDAKIGGMDAKIGGMDAKQNRFEETQDRLVAEVVGMKQYMREQMATKDELRETENRLATHMDGFIKLHENLDTELVALRGKYDRLEQRIEILEHHAAIR
ncbi:hypothetical protein HYW94_01590 [Candidatus Uhrbacteria bacterium]|nr:hypothetical protein [Candidatus Uhrbacteria bacterium]